MKVHIINLDPEDDHVSIRDKISWARAEKVVLVWPRRGRPLDRQLDLTIVQRHADRLGLELGLMTFDPEIIALAKRLDLPVFDSLDKLPPGEWNEPLEVLAFEHERPSLAELREAREAGSEPLVELDGRRRWIPVGISIAAVLAIALAVLPSAEIVMDPVGIPLEQNLSFWVDPTISSSSSRISGQTVTAEITGSKRIDTTGRVRLPQTASTGEVEITSLTDEEIVVPRGTGLRAGEIRFLTSEEVELEGGEGSIVSVAVEAAEPGISGNVAAEAIDSVEGPLGFLITVNNPETIRGGRDRVTSSVTADDMETLREQLEQELMENAEIALLTQLDGGFELVPGSLRITEVVDERYDIGEGEAAESLGLTLTLNIDALGYSVPLALDAAETEILTTISADQQLIPDSLSLEAVEASSDWPAMEVLFSIEGSLAETADRDLLRRAIVGDPKAEVEARLSDLVELDKKLRTMFEWCAKKKVFVDDDDIFVGTLGTETRTANYYMEWSPVWLWEAINDSDENFRAAWQQPGEVNMSDEQRESS